MTQYMMQLLRFYLLINLNGLIMYKIIYLVITIAIIHFTLYYFNFDFDQSFDYFYKKKIDLDLSKINVSINESINELKTLNECINNGEINTSFS